MPRWMPIGATLVPVLIATACAEAPRLHGSRLWVRLPAVPGNPAALYFTLHGGPADTTLVGVNCALAIRAEMHDGGAAMRAIRSVTIPAGAKVDFAPGGRHVMLYDVDPAIKRNGRLPIMFTFADGRRMELNARVLAAGDPPPAP